MNIITQINKIAALISEEDLDDWIIPKLFEHYKSKIKNLAYVAYGPSVITKEGPSVALKAFEQRAKTELRNAIYTFIFKSEHWKTGRDINFYLLKSLNRLAERIKNDGIKKKNILICPGCKFLNKKEYLEPVDNLWKCKECSSLLQRINEEINQYKNISDKNFIMRLEAKAKLFKSFSLHSRSGYRCPECSRFIPESCNGEHGISCPYSDCMFFGNINDLVKMAHPASLVTRTNVSLQTPIKDNIEMQEIFATDIINADKFIEINQNFNQELSLLKNIIDNQLKSVKLINSAGTMLQKVSMYEAYLKITEKFPEEMVSYLVHQKQTADFPLQSRIFQEYVKIIKDSLPYTIHKSKESYDVFSLTDPRISLFEGISVFDATITDNYTIPNNTVECYLGGRKFKDYGPCFIGLIIDIIDRRNQKSIKDALLNYSFVEINMNKDIAPGTPVTVKHYRILPHYEMGSLTYLQRTRKKIVSKIKQLNKKI